MWLSKIGDIWSSVLKTYKFAVSHQIINCLLMGPESNLTHTIAKSFSIALLECYVCPTTDADLSSLLNNYSLSVYGSLKLRVKPVTDGQSKFAPRAAVFPVGLYCMSRMSTDIQQKPNEFHFCRTVSYEHAIDKGVMAYK